jgi:hypothetical protein
MAMLRLASALLFLTLAAAGCTQPCDKDHICDIDSDGQLCDGSDYRKCDDSDRNATVGCMTSPRVAICTPDGWTFQDARQ